MAWAPGSCGELVQGWYRGRWLQVTCPVDVGSRAVVQLGGEGDKRRGSGPWSSRSWKAHRAIGEVLARLRVVGAGVPPLPARALHLRSALPRGKGMGSSTADVVAAAAAATRAVGREPTPDLLAEVALSVEPSDGTMLPGIVLFDHIRGTVREWLGPPPPLRMLVVDPGGTVDTLRRHARRASSSAGPPTSTRYVDCWRRAFEDVAFGVRTGDVEAVGRGASGSARLHAERRGARLFDRLEAVAKETGALGVNTAHSGTVFGLLMAPGGPDPAYVRERVRRRDPRARLCETVLVSGGVGW